MLFSVGVSYFGTTHSKEPIEIITNAPIDTLQFDDSKLKELVPVEEAIVKEETIETRDKKQELREETKERKINKKNAVIANNVKQSQTNKKITSSQTSRNDKINFAYNDKSIIKKNIVIPTKENTTKLEGIAIAKVDKTEDKRNTLEKISISRIKVNSNDLLYSVTHSPTEVKAYYAKYNVNREDILKTIKYELKKSNLKVNPNTILAEVERGIDDDLFQNNFMQKLKLKISDIAVAIADRNK